MLLGESWLARPWVGVPMGLWLVAGAVGIAHLRAINSIFYTTVRNALAPVRKPGCDPYAKPERKRFELDADGALTALLELTGVPARSVAQAKQRLADVAETITSRVTGSTSNTLRIGLDLSEADATALISAGAAQAAPGVAIEWVRVPAGLWSDAHRDIRGLDALIRREPASAGGAAVVVLPESDSPWREWSETGTLSFDSTFPARLDPTFVRLTGCDFGVSLTARLCADVIVAAAAQARAARRARARTGTPIHTNAHQPTDQAAELSMLRLAGTLHELHDSYQHAGMGLSQAPQAVKAAARAVSAWACATANAGSTAIDAEARVRHAETARAIATDEPQVVLRLAAARFAAMDEHGGMTALLAAFRLIRERGDEAERDPTGFLATELDSRTSGPLALGRIAASLGLLWATLPSTSRSYLRDDLMDELRHAGWLTENPRRQQTLRNVMDELERAENTLNRRHEGIAA